MTQSISAFTNDALGSNDAVGIAQRIATREISPLEATNAAIARLEAVEPTLNAVAHEAYDRARNDAHMRRPDDGRPFAGVPSFVKDNVDLAGLPVCHGSAAIDPRPIRRSNAPAQQYVDQGFVILGKSSMPAFGLTASTEFSDGTATHNPWNPGVSAGASSGGAGALVASGAVPIAHGNDGGGSIRIPAAANGLVGLKTTRGRTRDRPGARLLPVNLSAEGALCRTVRDAAHHLAAMEASYAHPRLKRVGLVTGAHPNRLRIGLATVSPNGAPVDPITMAQTLTTADVLSDLGHIVEAVTLPSADHFAEDFILYWALMAVLMVQSETMNHRGHFHADRLDAVTKGLQAKWHNNRGATFGTIWRLRKVRDIYASMFANFDVVLSPTLNHPAPKLGYLDPNMGFEDVFERMVNYVGFTPINNISGGPAIAVPTPLGPNGLPGSVQLSAPWGEEAALLSIAYELESAQPFPSLATTHNDANHDSSARVAQGAS